MNTNNMRDSQLKAMRRSFLLTLVFVIATAVGPRMSLGMKNLAATFGTVGAGRDNGYALFVVSGYPEVAITLATVIYILGVAALGYATFLLVHIAFLDDPGVTVTAKDMADIEALGQSSAQASAAIAANRDAYAAAGQQQFQAIAQGGQPMMQPMQPMQPMMPPQPQGVPGFPPNMGGAPQ